MQYFYTDLNQIERQWFERTQRIKWLVWSYQYRRRLQEQRFITAGNECDLMGEPLDVCLELQANRYSAQDLIGILQMSLEKREEFSSTPRCIPIDPYTNQPWTIPILYKIQGWLRKQSLPIQSVPLSVYMWLQTPYVSNTLFTEQTKPYFLHTYLDMKAIYNYNRDQSVTHDHNLIQLQTICNTVGIPLSAVDWNHLLHRLDEDTWKQAWVTMVLQWNHPSDEWISSEPLLDYKVIEWKDTLRNLFQVCQCWIRPTGIGRVYRRRRRLRIGME